MLGCYRVIDIVHCSLHRLSLLERRMLSEAKEVYLMASAVSGVDSYSAEAK